MSEEFKVTYMNGFPFKWNDVVRSMVQAMKYAVAEVHVLSQGRIAYIGEWEI